MGGCVGVWVGGGPVPQGPSLPESTPESKAISEASKTMVLYIISIKTYVYVLILIFYSSIYPLFNWFQNGYDKDGCCLPKAQRGQTPFWDHKVSAKKLRK